MNIRTIPYPFITKSNGKFVWQSYDLFFATYGEALAYKKTKEKGLAAIKKSFAASLASGQ